MCHFNKTGKPFSVTKSAKEVNLFLIHKMQNMDNAFFQLFLEIDGIIKNLAIVNYVDSVIY